MVLYNKGENEEMEEIKNESKEICKKHKKDMGILGMIQFAIANQASQETIDGLINKL